MPTKMVVIDGMKFFLMTEDQARGQASVRAKQAEVSGDNPDQTKLPKCMDPTLCQKLPNDIISKIIKLRTDEDVLQYHTRRVEYSHGLKIFQDHEYMRFRINPLKKVMDELEYTAFTFHSLADHFEGKDPDRDIVPEYFFHHIKSTAYGDLDISDSDTDSDSDDE